jgi:SHS2 domain-containing protein
MKGRFEEIEHTADMAIHVWGRDLADLFANAAYGMACQLADPDGRALTIACPVDLEAVDAETLLVAWLGELLYLAERDACVFFEFDMTEVTPTHLRAVARGRKMVEPRVYIKAVTFSDLEIQLTSTGYEVTVVFDV